MDEKVFQQFKTAFVDYLENLSLNDLRILGRYFNMRAPTRMKKNELLEVLPEIVAGTITPEGRNKRGAPIKNKIVSAEIMASINALIKRYLEPDGQAEMNLFDALSLGQYPMSGSNLVFHSNNAEEKETGDLRTRAMQPVYRGQLQFLNGVPRLLPLDCGDEEELIVVHEDLIREYGLREGDVLAGHTVQGSNAFVLNEILTINDMQPSFLQRGKFEESEVCNPDKLLAFVSKEHASLEAKYIDWLLPLYQGQRGFIVSAPKAGKSELIYALATSALRLAPDVKIIVLLSSQTLETVWKFRNTFSREQLMFTTYDDTPERQIFSADFVLKRAKRLVECGKNVLLLVDSFNTLARAFNETEASVGGKVLAGGVESKTLQYLRRFLNSARCFKSGGSLTMLGALSYDTGNPFDDVIFSELSGLVNYQIRLNDTLAKKRVYPAIDLLRSNAGTGVQSIDGAWESVYTAVAQEFLPKRGEEKLLELLNKSENYPSFLEKIGVKI